MSCVVPSTRNAKRTDMARDSYAQSHWYAGSESIYREMLLAAARSARLSHVKGAVL